LFSLSKNGYGRKFPFFSESGRQIFSVLKLHPCIVRQKSEIWRTVNFWIFKAEL